MVVTSPISEDKRLQLINRVLKGEQIKTVCCQEGVSRQFFYLWLKKWRRQPVKAREQAVLRVVFKHPEYGIRKIVGSLPKIGRRPLLGHHGVQNVLKRYGLLSQRQRSTYRNKRLLGVIMIAAAITVFLTTFLIINRVNIGY